MKYSSFERLVIGLGAITILGTIAVSLAGNGWPGWADFLAQILLLPVLIAAVHWGRKMGLVAAVVASTIVVILELPVLASTAEIGSGDVGMIAFSIAAFGLVGIVGGDLCGRVKYVIARYDESSTIDEWSRVYNQRRAAELLENARGRYARYGEPFSAIIITQSTALLSDLRPSRQRAMVRAVASYLRGDVRMVDEVARLDDGRFLVLLPHTPRAGGLVVAERLAEGVRRTLDESEESVSARCFSPDEDDAELGSLVANIAPRSEAYAASGA